GKESGCCAEWVGGVNDIRPHARSEDGRGRDISGISGLSDDVRRTRGDRMHGNARMRVKDQGHAVEWRGEEAHLPSGVGHKARGMNKWRIAGGLRRLNEEDAAGPPLCRCVTPYRHQGLRSTVTPSRARPPPSSAADGLQLGAVTPDPYCRRALQLQSSMPQG